MSNSEPWSEDLQFRVGGNDYDWTGSPVRLGLRKFNTPSAPAAMELDLQSGLSWLSPSRLGIRATKEQMATLEPSLYDLELRINDRTYLTGQVLVRDGILS